MPRRLLFSGLGIVGTLLAVTVISFLLVALLPGDQAVLLLGDSATPERVAAVRSQLGLDKPLPVRYIHWLGNVLSGDFGTSIHSGQATMDIILSRLPVTLELLLLTQAVALGLAIPLGIWSAYRKGSAVDTATLTGSLALLSTPSFVVGLFLIFIFALQLQWLPATGHVPISEGVGGNLKSFVLPVLALALIEVPVYLRLLRSEMIGTLHQNFIALARGMGIPTTRILLENALRPSSLNLITVVGINMGRLMGGAIIIESMFALPGIGQLLVESIYQQEYMMMQGIVLFVAIMFIAINLLTDFLYVLVDPRMLRHGEA